MSYRQFAEKVGLTLTTVSRYANSQRTPRASEILRSADVLGVTCDYMLGLSDDPHKTRLSSAQPERWIPCSERLPEPQTEVVVSFDNGEVKILWQNWADPSSLSNYPGEPLAYIGGDGIPHTYEEGESMKTYAVAWMPLPEPYREEGD